MKSVEQILAQWHEAPRPPVDRGTVASICVRKGDGVHEAPPAVQVSVEQGVEGDRWSGGPDPERHSQITLINATVAALIASDSASISESGDNFVVDLDLSETNLPVGSRLRLGTALVEVTPEPHTGCRKFRNRFGDHALRFVSRKELKSERLRGIHCEVIEAGRVGVGDVVIVERR